MPEQKKYSTEEAMTMTGLTFKGLIYRRMAAGVKPTRGFVGEVRVNWYTEDDMKKLLAYAGARKLPELKEPPPPLPKLKRRGAKAK